METNNNRVVWSRRTAWCFFFLVLFVNFFVDGNGRLPLLSTTSSAIAIWFILIAGLVLSLVLCLLDGKRMLLYVLMIVVYVFTAYPVLR